MVHSNTRTASREKFMTDLERGKTGEDKVFEILRSYSNVSNVTDVSNDRKYQAVEIDAIVSFTNRPPATIEIKTDFYERTGNIVFEVYSSKSKDTPGGFVKTLSDYIFYYFPNIDALYIIETIPFKQYILDNRFNLRYSKMGDDAKGFLIPIKTLLNQPWFCKVR